MAWLVRMGVGAFGVIGLISCGTVTPSREVVVSVKGQQVALMEQGHPVRVYPCSTSKFCVGDQPGRFGTPLGRLAVAKKIGDGVAPGTVFKHRQPTGEVLRPNAPGRDPIVTRIMWLRGEQTQNRNAYGRCIYIHGTPEEWSIGYPASYGCVRMRSMDVIDLFNRVPEGTPVRISKSALPSAARSLAAAQSVPPPPAPVAAPAPAPAPALALVAAPVHPNYGKATSGRVANSTAKFGPNVP